MVEGSALTTDDWCTPKWLADALGPFDCDPCSSERSHIDARRTYALDHVDPYRRDGLAIPWMGSIWVNPPYSNVGPWAQKLADHDGPWCTLVKLDPTTKWWATLMAACPTIAPFRKRIKFEGDRAMTANFPSVLVYSAWRPPLALRPHLWLPNWERAA